MPTKAPEIGPQKNNKGPNTVLPSKKNNVTTIKKLHGTFGRLFYPQLHLGGILLRNGNAKNGDRKRMSILKESHPVQVVIQTLLSNICAWKLKNDLPEL